MAAQPIRCDYTDCPELADVIVSNLQNGETMAWCGPHYIAASIAIAESTAEAEADQAAAEAEARLTAAAPPEPEDHELDAGAVEDRLAGEGQPAVDAAPARTVKRGHSASRIAHEARQRAKLAHEDGGEARPAAGPDDDDDSDEDELAPSAGQLDAADRSSTAG